MRFLTKFAGPDGSYEGDWICPKCDNVNFAFRAVCNIKKCGAARPSHVRFSYPRSINRILFYTFLT